VAILGQKQSSLESYEAPKALNERMLVLPTSSVLPHPQRPWYLHPGHKAHSSAPRRHEEQLKVQQLKQVVCLQEDLYEMLGQEAPC
jgi:hypothetical protein